MSVISLGSASAYTYHELNCIGSMSHVRSLATGNVKHWEVKNGIVYIGPSWNNGAMYQLNKSLWKPVVTVRVSTNSGVVAWSSGGCGEGP